MYISLLNLWRKINSNLQIIFVRRSNVETDSSEKESEDADDIQILECNGIKYPHKSWYFIHNSTIKGITYKEKKIEQIFYYFKI